MWATKGLYHGCKVLLFMDLPKSTLSKKCNKNVCCVKHIWPNLNISVVALMAESEYETFDAEREQLVERRCMLRPPKWAATCYWTTLRITLFPGRPLLEHFSRLDDSMIDSLQILHRPTLKSYSSVDAQVLFSELRCFVEKWSQYLKPTRPQAPGHFFWNFPYSQG